MEKLYDSMISFKPPQCLKLYVKQPLSIIYKLKSWCWKPNLKKWLYDNANFYIILMHMQSTFHLCEPSKYWHIEKHLLYNWIPLFTFATHSKPWTIYHLGIVPFSIFILTARDNLKLTAHTNFMNNRLRAISYLIGDHILMHE